MKNKFQLFLLFFGGGTLAVIAPYALLRFCTEIIFYFLTGKFEFLIPLKLVYGAIATGFIIAVLLLFYEWKNYHNR